MNQKLETLSILAGTFRDCEAKLHVYVCICVCMFDSENDPISKNNIKNFKSS